ncbi:MAG TPA: acyltransferase [Rhodopila sp.]|nr:acyltransferase [Rhodopila sp.]
MGRLDCLDGLRGLLALYVLLGHMAPFVPLPGWLQATVSHGEAAVDLFFVLSGLVIVQSIGRSGGRAMPFLVTRAARIFPVFLPTFLVAVLIQPLSCGFERMPWLSWDNPARSICVGGWPPHWAAEIVAHLTMTHGLFPHLILPDAWVSFLGSAWSLSTEWQFYALALLVRDRDRLVRLLLVLGTAGALWRLAGPDAWQFSRAFLPNQGQYFALGVSSLPVVLRQRSAERRLGVVLAMTVAICASHGAVGKLLPPVAWAACLAAQAGMRGIAPDTMRHVLRHRVSLYLGAISYCLYLVNEPIHKICGNLLSHLAGNDARLFTALWIPAAIALPVAASALLHAWVEAPALSRGRAVAAGMRVACPVQNDAIGL